MESHQVTAMEVNRISKECLKPLSPTPPHLRYLNLSILDQLIPAPYAPIIFFYNHLHDSTRALGRFKDSLSQILPMFYPLAGIINDEFTVDCNDDGFLYLEAQVNCNMEDYLRQPDLLMLHKFLPVDIEKAASGMTGIRVGNVQVNSFKCGGVAIGLCVSHKILDGAGVSMFMNSWAAANRGEFEAIIPPNFNSASVFPAANPWFKKAAGDIWGAIFRHGKFVTRRLVFDSASISKLKGEIDIACDSSNRYPTRIEAVSALLWKSFINGSRNQDADNNGASKPSVMTHIVNLRRRIPNSNLDLTDRTLGNLLWMASSTVPPQTELEMCNLSDKVRQSIAEIDIGFINKLHCSEFKSAVTESFKGLNEAGSNVLGFTSWCKLGLYDADFGWGRPAWISSVGMRGCVFLNLILLVESRDGEGIEAWVTMDECDMNLLAQDSEVGRFASMDPSQLQSGILRGSACLESK